MSPLLESLNRVLIEALAASAADAPAGGTAAGDTVGDTVGDIAGSGTIAGDTVSGSVVGIELRSVVLDDTGARIVALLRPPLGEGELVLRLGVEPAQGDRQRLTLVVEQGPQAWAAALEPFRRLLERARLHLELDFGHE